MAEKRKLTPREIFGYEPGRHPNGFLPLSYLEQVLRPTLFHTRSGIMVDLGGGKGAAAAYFSVLGFEAYNLDIAPPRNRLQQSVAADLQNLPLAEESVDLAHCKDVLVHVPDYDELFRQVAKSLVPEGLFVLTSVETIVEPHFCVRRKWLPKEEQVETIFFTTFEDYQKKVTRYRRNKLYAVSPTPYYPVFMPHVERSLVKSGFEVLDQIDWQPEEGEIDYYTEGRVGRFVYFAQKKV